MEFRLFRGTENSRISVANRSAEEKNAWNSVPWNKIRSKRSEFCSEPFRRREKNSEFRSVEQKYKQTLGFLFITTIPWNRLQLGILIRRCLRQKHAVNSVCWSRFFVKQILFMPFYSVPSFGIDNLLKWIALSLSDSIFTATLYLFSCNFSHLE